jgi:hypothetical protein
MTQVRQIVESSLVRGFVEQTFLQSTLDHAFVQERVFDLHHATPILAAVTARLASRGGKSHTSVLVEH